MEFDALVPLKGPGTGLARRPLTPSELSDGYRDVAEGLDRAERSILPQQNPAETLAALMDFSGSVALAELLHTPLCADTQRGASSEASKIARRLQDHVSNRMDTLLTMSLRPLNGPRAPTVPKLPELLEAIAIASGSTENSARAPDAAAASKLARKIGAPLRAALSASLRQAQAQLAGMRAELAPDLRALGPRAERLERIDAALQRSIQNKVIELFERMELAAEQTFERACVHACSLLPITFTPDDLASWTHPDGWIERYRGRCVHMTEALFGHMQRSLEGLLVAAIHAEVVL
jgi:hypothetical protein